MTGRDVLVRPSRACPLLERAVMSASELLPMCLSYCEQNGRCMVRQCIADRELSMVILDELRNRRAD
jgi:hypothetical protein